MSNSAIDQNSNSAVPTLGRRQLLKGGIGVFGLVSIGTPLLEACGATSGSGGTEQHATVVLPDAISTLDPPLVNSINVAAGERHTIESFVSLDSEGKVVPALATSWDVKPDQVTWIMHLRKGVSFHDGSDWTAAVAKKNLDRYLGDPTKFPRAQSYGFIDRVEALDKHTLLIHTKAPNSGFINWMSYFALGFHSGAALDKYGDKIGLHGVGTGPFKVDHFTPNQELVMSRFAKYWGEQPKLEKLTLTTVPDASSRVNMLETGQGQVSVAIQPPQIPIVKKSNDMTLQSTPSVRMAFIGINSQNPLLTDVRVRKALNFAVDSAETLKNVLNGEGTLAQSVMPAIIPGYSEQTLYKYDPDAAKKLLDEAGWRVGPSGNREHDGQPVVLTLRTTDGHTPGDKLTCEAVQGYLSEVGIKTKILVLEQNDYFASLEDKSSISKTGLNYFAYGSSIVDPTHALGLLEGSWSNVNSIYARYRNKEFDAAYDRMVHAVADEAARNSAAAEAQSIAWDDACWIFLFSLNYLVANVNSIKNVQISPNEFYNLDKARRV
ncbi:MAG TPA: ABC transporter substrate-binding protein [Arthrobacter sp.]|nr:ABC transporter substrate-binding protein [Arthrobacter sp.]